MDEHYTFGVLRQEELEAWFDHVGEVFGPSGTPRSYFVDHWTNDPTSTLDSIFVAREKSSNSIVSTVRVFNRPLYIAGNVVKGGGIGEVSTKESHRGKGLANRLMQMAAAHIKSQGWALGSLHTGKQAPFYEKLGWINTTARYTLLKVSLKTMAPKGKAGGLDAAVHPLTKTGSFLAEAKAMHASLATRSKLSGLVVRSEEYWQSWIPAETYRWGAGGMISAEFSNSPSIGFMVANFLDQPRVSVDSNAPRILRVKELVLSDHSTVSELGPAAIVAILVQATVERLLKRSDSVEELTVRLPAPIYQLYLNNKIVGSVISGETESHYVEMSVIAVDEVSELGFMYLVVDAQQLQRLDPTLPDPSSPAFSASFATLVQANQLFFNTDGF